MLLEEYSLKDRTAIVTGGGRGIGFSIARQLGRAGAKVAVADIRRTLAEDAARALSAESIEAMALEVDVSSAFAVHGMVEEVMVRWGRLDILVNNAGIGATATFEEVTEEEWDRVLDVNLKSVFLCTQAALPIMKKQGSGKILNVASMAGRTGGRAAAVNYTASKAGVIGVTRSMAMHLGRYGVRVNGVAPGIIETEMTSSWPSATKADFLRQIPAGRLGTPEDVAKAALFLCSDAADYLTGVVLDVTGGLVMS